MGKSNPMLYIPTHSASIKSMLDKDQIHFLDLLVIYFSI